MRHWTTEDLVDLAYAMNEDVLAEAHGWLTDCFQDCPADLTPGEIVAAIERCYVGGWITFVANWRLQ